ncbi:MAG: pyrroline-5-carboxylate reductase [Parachlamydiaceae bacterium]|nr:pyrroline-5-carboxylate reductase [Parachlamydiaceae bacterium]
MKIGIIGCGHMGGGIARRLSDTHEIFLCGHNFKATEGLAKEINATNCKNVEELVDQVELIILAVKPKDLNNVITEFKGKIFTNKILISVLSGISLEKLANNFSGMKITRMMPNMAVVQGEGVVGLSALDNLEVDQKELLTKLFLPLGLVKWFPETMMDAVTALTGSGPAFVLVMIEAMVEAGVKMGFNAIDGQALVLQMIQGTLSMLKETKKHPAELKWQIASPGGTTIAGLNELETCGLRNGIIKTFLATYQQSILLGKLV